MDNKTIERREALAEGLFNWLKDAHLLIQARPNDGLLVNAAGQVRQAVGKLDPALGNKAMELPQWAREYREAAAKATAKAGAVNLKKETAPGPEYTLDKADLIALAEQQGVKVDKRWSAEKIQEALENAD